MSGRCHDNRMSVGRASTWQRGGATPSGATDHTQTHTYTRLMTTAIHQHVTYLITNDNSSSVMTMQGSVDRDSETDRHKAMSDEWVNNGLIDYTTVCTSRQCSTDRPTRRRWPGLIASLHLILILYTRYHDTWICCFQAQLMLNTNKWSQKTALRIIYQIVSYVTCRMSLHVHLLVHSPSLLGDMTRGRGSFAQSYNPTAVYMTWPSFPTAWFRNSFPTSATHCLPNTTN